MAYQQDNTRTKTEPGVPENKPIDNPSTPKPKQPGFDENDTRHPHQENPVGK